MKKKKRADNRDRSRVNPETGNVDTHLVLKRRAPATDDSADSTGQAPAQSTDQKRKAEYKIRS